MKTEKQEIVCNCCKKIMGRTDKIPVVEYLHVEKEWGYFSEKDGEKQEFDICESCYDKWVKSFQIPIVSKEVTELV
ncbi:MAG: hypothetical protein HFH48_06055 [Lachnospiraceae bacterium]|nr:hypothetical protein [Lachnospiraceae bacterium]